MSGKTWFSTAFGFLEEGRSYDQVRSNFQYDADTFMMTSVPSGQQFYIGPFETPSIAELRARLPPPPPDGTQGLKIDEIVGDIRFMHSCEKYRGAVIQVASQFNALEMVGPGVSPEQGITRYLQDSTQGPACALSCPAATVYRNYIHGPGMKGQGGGESHQINGLRDVEKVVGPQKYWCMKNGYAMPLNGASMGDLGELITKKGLREKVIEAVRVSIHWDTQVGIKGPTEQRVCQVFCSALPCAYCHVTRNRQDWAVFASAVLDSAYEATFAAAAIVSGQRGGQRVTVLLTRLGLGAFGNSPAWVRPAIDKACAKYASYPLDVHIVKFGSNPHDIMKASTK